jgi:hypothetical protein
MVDHAVHAGQPSQVSRPDIQADIAAAFRAAFLSIAAFTTAGFFLALTNPSRRV